MNFHTITVSILALVAVACATPTPKSSEETPMPKPETTNTTPSPTFSPGQQGLTAVNVDDHGTILHGYDVVAFQTENQAVKGSVDFAATHDGATYRFASAKNRDDFRANPAKFTPAYGGYCSTGVAFGMKFDGDPTKFTATNGRLYMFGSQQAKEMWVKDVVGNTARADSNWAKVSLRRGFDPIPQGP